MVFDLVCIVGLAVYDLVDVDNDRYYVVAVVVVQDVVARLGVVVELSVVARLGVVLDLSFVVHQGGSVHQSGVVHQGGAVDLVVDPVDGDDDDDLLSCNENSLMG